MEFTVPNMSCGHCTAAIEKAVKQADPAAWIECSIPDREVEIDSTLDAAALQAVLAEAGYPASLKNA